MIRFAYPNIRKDNFIGCGRFLAAERLPGEEYREADPRMLHEKDVMTACSILAPESFDSDLVIFEERDKSLSGMIVGDSLDLAYLLALIHRSRSPGLEEQDKIRDIWCTGLISIREGRARLDAVDTEGFGIKLEAFLAQENHDLLFIVPAPNMQPQQKTRCIDSNVRVLSLKDLKKGPLQRLLEQKTVLQIHGNELPELVDLIFREYIPISTLHEAAKSITLKTLKDFQGYRYDEDLFLEPSKWQNILDTFLSDYRPALMVAAPAGSGKTCLLCHTAKKLQEYGDLVVFWHHRNVPIPLSHENVSRHLGFERNIDITLSNIATYRVPYSAQKKIPRFIFIIDGIDESDDPKNLLRQIINFAEKICDDNQGGNNSLSPKIIFSIRDVALRYYGSEIELNKSKYFFRPLRSALSDESTMPLLEPFNELELHELLERYSRKYNLRGIIDRLSQSVKELLYNPLLLRITCEAFRGQNIPIGLNEDEIFETYLQSRYLFTRYGTQLNLMRDTLQMMAQRMYLLNSKELEIECFTSWLRNRGIFFEKFYDIYGMLLNEGFLMEITPGKVQFTFERLFEFYLGRHVLASMYEDEDGNIEMGKMLADVFSKGESVPSIYQGLKAYLRITMRRNISMGISVLKELINFKEGAEGIIISELLGEFESRKEHPLADCVLFELEEIELRKRANIIKIAMELSFESGAIDRLAKMGKLYLEMQKEMNSCEGECEALMWLGNLLYNRADDYKGAIEVLEKALGVLGKLNLNADLRKENQMHEIKYCLARVLSDFGDRKRAEALAKECLKYYRKGKGEFSRRGMALSHFLLYMINGDASGKFRSAKPDLITAGDIFRELNDQQAIARVLINGSIVEQYTSSFEKAIECVKNGICLCRGVGDIQGKACGLICLASIYIQEAAFVDDFHKRKLLEEALNTIEQAEEINRIRQEAYLDTLCLANRGMTYFVDGNEKEALEIFKKVIRESKKSGDFFNLFDAEVMVASLLKDKKKLLSLLRIAEKRQYTQGSLHVCREISRLLAAGGKEKEKYENKANAIADELGWGHDPRQSIFMGWYAGIFI